MIDLAIWMIWKIFIHMAMKHLLHKTKPNLCKVFEYILQDLLNNSAARLWEKVQLLILRFILWVNIKCSILILVLNPKDKAHSSMMKNMKSKSQSRADYRQELLFNLLIRTRNLRGNHLAICKIKHAVKLQIKKKV